MPVRWRDLPNDSDDEDDNFQYRQYEQTLMYGRYTRDLGDFVKEEAKRLRNEKLDKPQDDLHLYRGRVHNECTSGLKTIWKYTFARIGEDWVFLAVLGVLMACISFLMDFGIAICNKARIWLYRDLASGNEFLQYLAWVSLPVCLIIFSAGFVHLTAPQAVGSGIPEMKTILRGVVLKEYLTFKTLVAKIIGLTATLGTGLPLGKEGPFVHIASIVATLLSRAVTSFKGIYENESRNSEMLAAACAVGVACSFAAPIGGVLFSIEVTSVYFAVRNYWRGFFAAVCGAMMFRLLAVWFNDEETLTALFKTHFQSISFDPMELFVYALTGIACGFLGALFVWVHRQYVIFMRRNKKMKTFLQKSRLIYPFMVVLVYCTLSFPLGFGMFVAGDLTTHHQVVELFSNITWTKDNPTVHEFEIIENWRTPWTNIFVNLLIYIFFTFCGSVVSSTLPVPSGIFIPVFKMGAALGRIVGESMAVIFPNGLSYGGIQHNIIPGGYSIVGAAAFAGAVTHTISTSVIVFELTGQITHILPVMVAVLIANGIAQLLQPSVYDSIIKIKKLPYLPDILTSKSGAYNLYVEDFMVRDVKYIWYGISYRDLKKILVDNKKIRALPLVDSPDSMVLLGSIQRCELITILEEHLGRDKRTKIVSKWKQAADKALAAELEKKERLEREVKERLLQREELSGVVASTLPVIGITAIAPSGVGSMELQPLPPRTSSHNFRGLSPKRDSGTTPNVESKLDSPPKENKKPTFVLSTSEETLQSFESEVQLRPKLTLDLTPATTSTAAPSADEGVKPNLKDSTEGLRPSSRFAVTKVETPSKNESSVTLQVDPVEIPEVKDVPLRQKKFQSNSLPRKSILKKTRSFIIQPSSNSPCVSPTTTPYATVHAGDSKLWQTIETVMRKRNLKLEKKLSPKKSESQPALNFKPEITPQLLFERVQEEQEKMWEEEEELDKRVEFRDCHIDPAPFQLVERTSLLKVHSLFSMLSLSHAYVTAIGRLIGVVALKELRRAIEDANVGDFPQKPDTAAPAPIPKREYSADGRESPDSSLKTNPSTGDYK